MTPRQNNKSKVRIPIKSFARAMRFDPTRHEQLLWDALLATFQPFRCTVHAQEPIGPYVADFYVSPCNIVIEVDGHSHHTLAGKNHDAKRDNFMIAKGIRVIRFQNRQIARNAQACAKYVLCQCGDLPERKERIKVTYCPPGSALKAKTKSERRLFWNP
jgi:very-short-patch-repair endonuclease